MRWETHFVREVGWSELERLQERCFEDVCRAPSEKAHCLVSEPHPTFTHGRSAESSDLLWSAEECTRQNINVAQVKRGGRWTYHGPGQIVLYPIVSISELGYGSRGVHRFLGALSLAVEATLAQWNVSGVTRRETPLGLFVENRKIASFGIAISRGICLHGVALYLTPQNSAFAGIRPCGAAQPGMTTSVLDHGIALKWGPAARQLAENVKKRVG